MLASGRAAFVWALAAIALSVLLAATPAHAQVLYGSLVGNVSDPSDAPIPGAIVVIVQTETNQSRQTVTNNVGQYNFPTIPGGTYEVRVTADGFRPTTQTGVTVSTNTVTRINVAMQLGTITESVMVSAQALTLQTDRAEVRHEVTSRTLQNLPVPPGRNYQQSFNILPGFTPPRNAHSVPSNPSRSLQYEVNGVSAASNNIRMDGATQYNVWLPHVTAYVPALESIETVNVVTNSFDAEQGLAGGAAINVQVKSGTNDVRGSAFWYHNNNNTKARPFFLPANQDMPKLVFNQFGGTVGGPIKRDKLFYFTSYEGTTDRQFAGALSTVPTMAMRAGDMSASPNQIYDPWSGTVDGRNRTPFPGKQVPASLMDPAAMKINAMLPAPTFPNALNDNFYSQGQYLFDRHTIDAKVNYNATSKLTSYARFSFLDYTGNFPTRFGNEMIGSALAGGNPGNGYGRTYSFTGALTYVATPTLILDTNVGWTRMDTNVEQPRLDEKVGLDLLGIPGTNGPRRLEGGWPGFGISGFTTFGLADSYMPYFRSDPQYQWIGNGNWTRGTHNIRFGAEFSWQNLNHIQPEFYGGSWGAPGGFSFNGGSTTLNGGPASNQFNAYSQFLLGLPSQMGKLYQWPDIYSTRTSMQSLYVRDQWNATRKLTLNLGVRWNSLPHARPRRPRHGALLLPRRRRSTATR
jgi:hypothetical protein